MGLDDIERARAKELRDAERFIAKHELGSLPGQRFDTGESSGRQSVAPGRLRDDDGMPRLHRDTVSYDGYKRQDNTSRTSADGADVAEGLDAYMEDHPEARFMVVGAAVGGLDYEEVEKRARMNHVYSFIRPEQVDLLRKWGIEGMTLEAIAEEEKVSKQAVHKRLKKAQAAFKEAYVKHWDDEDILDFG